MAEKMFFFDSTEDDERIYNAADFARFHHQIIGNGVSNTEDLPDLEVKAEDDMDISLGAGYMFANGYLYENTSSMTLTHDTADSDNDRIDRVIIRFDSNPEERTIKAVIKKGTPDSSPNPPSLKRDDYIYEMSVAQVRIKAGKSYIEDSEITDERADDEVCGYIPLHNIYRGMKINEVGMITMPNQSYVEMNKTSTTKLTGTEQDPEASGNSFFINTVKIDPIIDRQNEIKNGEMHIKSDGTYIFTFHTRRIADSGSSDTQKLEAYIVVNGESAVNDRLYMFNNYFLESQYYGSNIKYLKSGDIVELVMARRYEREIELEYLRLNVAKIN